MLVHDASDVFLEVSDANYLDLKKKKTLFTNTTNAE